MSTYKQGDSRPALRLSLDADPIEASDSVRIYAESEDDGTVLLDVQASVDDADQPVVEYDWADELDGADPVDYRVEAIIERADGTVETWPREGFAQLSVTEQLPREDAVLDLDAGETETIATGETDRYARADIEADATLTVESGGTLRLTGAKL